ncbi:MAG TPA: DNA translocase FtsK 4TM domain-containing protein [Patescibacteria group bacterium]|nr:DNA translocase FtsK 4TM domain-containing protein [Patescibacteria group bacterium]
MAKSRKNNGNGNGKKGKPQDKAIRPEPFELSPDTRRGLFTILLLIFALLFTLATFGMAGMIGGYLNGFGHKLLGKLAPLLPAFLLFVAIGRLRREAKAFDAAAKLGAALFILTLGSMIHLLVSRPDGVAFGKRLEEGGGYLGMLVSYLLEQGLGFWGAVIVIGGGILASLLLVFKTSLEKLVFPHRALMDFVRKKPGEHGGTIGAPSGPMPAEAKPAFASKEMKDEPAMPMDAPVIAGEHVAATPKKIWRKVALPLDLLNNKSTKPTSGDIGRNQHVIQKTLENFGIPCEMGEVSIGPTVTQFTLKPHDGIKLARITGLNNDLALALAAHPIRIEAPIPGKALVGIEVPNQAVAIVNLREILESNEFKGSRAALRIALGKDVAGKPWLADLAKMPHMLVAGSTGSGKTVCLNSIIVSLLYTYGPDELRFIMVDPKRVELTAYNNIPHLMVPAITEVAKTVNALKWAIGEMDRRFTQLARFGKRDIASYNEAADEKMPYLVIVIDELADLMVSSAANEVETCIIRLAQMARAVGIHLILATQRPSVDVITGLIKANFNARIAFAVASGTDSRTILDSLGAEKLVGRGDMLFTSAELSKPKRLQGTYISDLEIKKVTDFIKTNFDAPDYQHEIVDRLGATSNGVTFKDEGGQDEPLLDDAQDIIVRNGKASASFLQRRMQIGYARAARILDLLEEKGVIGPGNGAKPREILVPHEGGGADMDDEEGALDGGMPEDRVL